MSRSFAFYHSSVNLEEVGKNVVLKIQYNIFEEKCLDNIIPFSLEDVKPIPLIIILLLIEKNKQAFITALQMDDFRQSQTNKPTLVCNLLLMLI